MADEPSTKKAKLDNDNGAGESETRDALVEMEKVQAAIDGLNEKASDEILKIEQKYNELRRPEYERRNEFINKIESFWTRAILSHPQLSSVIEEVEEEFIHAITGLQCEEHEDIRSGFRIKFTFAPNPFIENEVVTKEFFLNADTPYTKSTELKWKDGNNLITNKGMVKAARENASPKVSDLDSLSFCEWLAGSGDPSSDEIAEVIKDDLWPNPLQYYLTPELIDDEADLEDDDEAEDDEAAEDD